MSETTRIADQLHRAFNGEAWHGPALLELLQGVEAGTAAKRPPAGAHSIWEIVRHIQVWDGAAIRRMAGEVVQPTGDEDWPKVTDLSQNAWKNTTIITAKARNPCRWGNTQAPSAPMRNAIPATTRGTRK